MIYTNVTQKYFFGIENKKEIFKEEYLTNFIINNLSIDKLNN